MPPHDDDTANERSNNNWTRRGFVGAGLAMLGLFTVSAPALAVVGGTRSLTLINTNTKERFGGVYCRDGVYDRDALRRLSVLLRDYKANQVVDMDPKLFDLLHRLNSALDTKEPFEVICGYRTPRTNAAARSKSWGVAKNSLHIQGMAIDIRVPGRSLTGVARTAVALRQGGVGLYRRTNYVHLDTGPVRSW
jgi:uncharacterized protein YcbK (DUF882 family)